MYVSTRGGQAPIWSAETGARSQEQSSPSAKPNRAKKARMSCSGPRCHFPSSIHAHRTRRPDTSSKKRATGSQNETRNATRQGTKAACRGKGSPRKQSSSAFSWPRSFHVPRLPSLACSHAHAPACVIIDRHHRHEPYLAPTRAALAAPLSEFVTAWSFRFHATLPV
jgi:hypothetical protein